MEEQHIGGLIQQRRRQLGLSLRDLEKMTGIDRSRLSQIELGKRRPGLPTIARLAVALQMSTTDLSLAAGNPAPDLPSIRPYLRAAYGLTAESAADVERYVRDKYGTVGQPQDGEDEQPEG